MKDIIVYNELSNSFDNAYNILKNQSKNLAQVNTSIANLISIVNNEYNALENYSTLAPSDFPYLPLNTNNIDLDQIISNQINYTYKFKSKVNGSCKIYVLINGYTTNRKDNSPSNDSFEVWNGSIQKFYTNFVAVDNRIGAQGYYLLSSNTINIYTNDIITVNLNFNNSNGYKKYVKICNNGIYVGSFSSFSSKIVY